MALNIGILAHVDAGKTTLTEQMLFMSGAVNSMGRVDEGSAHTDFMEIERTRGISVRAASAFFTWKGQDVNIIDTPGHSDFTGETQRAIRAMDIAVLVLSALEGVQSQTSHIWNALRRIGVPVIFFINKTDRTGADVRRVIWEMEEILGASPISLLPYDREMLIETLSGTNDTILEKYVEHGAGAISDDELSSALLERFYGCGIHSYVAGSALKGEGICGLMDLIVSLARDDTASAGQDVSGIIFKLEHDSALGRVAYVRLYSGTLKNRDTVRNARTGADEKIVQIRKVQGAKERDTGKLSAGDIGAVYGLSGAMGGDIIGDPSRVPAGCEIASPMLRIRLSPADEKDYPALAAALEQLAAEDPLLDVIWQKESRELLVHVIGLIQIEVLRSILYGRFSLKVETGAPQVIYKERPASSGFGYVEYTMPKPCWAVMRFAVEPLPIGSGVIFESRVHNDKIYTRYQAQVEQAIPESLRQGPRGWEVTDLKITLVDGEHHIQHTHPLDFLIAAPMGIMDALTSTGTELMEPVLKFSISFPEELSGRMIGEIISMRGTFDSPSVHGDSMVLCGRMPLASSMDFPVRFSSLTGGKGLLHTSFDGYEPAPDGECHDVPYRGVSPLDRAKYILYRRGALG